MRTTEQRVFTITKDPTGVALKRAIDPCKSDRLANCAFVRCTVANMETLRNLAKTLTIAKEQTRSDSVYIEIPADSIVQFALLPDDEIAELKEEGLYSVQVEPSELCYFETPRCFAQAYGYVNPDEIGFLFRQKDTNEEAWFNVNLNELIKHVIN